MDFTKDPNDRRRVDAETQRKRDAEVARMRRSGTPFRTIASRMGMSLGAVQKSVRRGQKFADALASGEPGNVLAVVPDELTCEDVWTPDDVQRLNALERWRLRHMDTELGRAERARVVAEREAQRQRFAAEHADAIAVGYQRAWDAEHQTRISDGHSWRDGVDAALSDDLGVDRDDDW